MDLSLLSRRRLSPYIYYGVITKSLCSYDMMMMVVVAVVGAKVLIISP